MRIIIAILCSCIISMTHAATKYTYEEVLKRHSELKQEAENILTLSRYLIGRADRAVKAYENGDPSFWKAMNQEMVNLEERAAKLGDMYTQPYSSCYQLANSTNNYWGAIAGGTPNAYGFKEIYEQSRKDCRQEIINKPEDRSNLITLDASNP